MASANSSFFTGDGSVTRRLCDRVWLVLLFIAAEWHPGNDATAHGSPALHVTNAVFEDAIEERLPFLRRLIRVGAGQLQHRILHGIQCVILMPERGLGDFECLELDAGQKLVQRTGTGIGRRFRQFHVAV